MQCKLKFQPKNNRWVNSTKTCRINLNTGTAWSYNTIVGRLINGTWFVLDTYPTVTTKGHLSAIHGVLRYADVVAVRSLVTESFFLSAVNHDSEFQLAGLQGLQAKRFSKHRAREIERFTELLGNSLRYIQALKVSGKLVE